MLIVDGGCADLCSKAFVTLQPPWATIATAAAATVCHPLSCDFEELNVVNTGLH